MSAKRAKRTAATDIMSVAEPVFQLYCVATQYSDQMVCKRCNLQWDVNDPEPPLCGLLRVAPGERE